MLNIPQFQNCRRCEKDLKGNKDKSLHLGRKYGRIFVLWHYLFLVAHSFPRASLSENCLLLGTDNVRGQISKHIFAPNSDYCLYILHHLSVYYELTMSSAHSWLDSSVGGALHRYRRCHGFQSRSGSNIFLDLISQLLKLCVQLRSMRNHVSIRFQNVYILRHSSLENRHTKDT